VSSDKVDLSQIRGDWGFHCKYTTNAMEQTLKRANKYWRELKKAGKKEGQVPVDGHLMDEFIEACMQTRALTDDFLILAECKPGAAKKTRKKAKKKSKKKAKKKTSKKAGGRK
jgi:hypothetical protein